jgi:hypothetical protein
MNYVQPAEVTEYASGSTPAGWELEKKNELARTRVTSQPLPRHACQLEVDKPWLVEVHTLPPRFAQI